MTRTVTLALFALASLAPAAQRPAELIQKEIEQAKKDVPKLAEVLELRPGMVVADVGAGSGAMATVMAKWLGPSGHVYATDIEPARLAEIRELAARENLHNVTVIEGAARSTTLPSRCCDAIFMRDVYHHLTYPEEINKSLLAALKSGGRLAIIDFEADEGSELPDGVAENRGGHGVPPSVVIKEVGASGLKYLTTISAWPPDDDHPDYFLVLFRRP
jgi:precorrin-6B methylase 2